MNLRKSLDHWLWYSVRRRLLDRDLEEIKVHMKGRVLEIGNGRKNRRGRFRPPLENVDAWIYLDLENDRRPHLQSDVEQLPLGNAIFDTVVCLEVLEYVTRPKEALLEMKRVLKSTGNIILSAPFMHRTDSPHDYWRFSEHGLRHMLREIGFSIVWLRAQGNALAVAVNIIKYVIYSQPSKWYRQCLACAALPMLLFLWKLDEAAAKYQPLLTTFSTGYLTIADIKRKNSLV